MKKVLMSLGLVIAAQAISLEAKQVTKPWSPSKQNMGQNNAFIKYGDTVRLGTNVNGTIMSIRPSKSKGRSSGQHIMEASSSLSDDLFTIESVSGGKNNIRSGDIVRFKHQKKGLKLHSHICYGDQACLINGQIASNKTALKTTDQSMQEVTAFGGNDTNDNWYIYFEEENLTPQTPVKIVHQSSTKRYGVDMALKISGNIVGAIKGRENGSSFTLKTSVEQEQKAPDIKVDPNAAREKELAEAKAAALAAEKAAAQAQQLADQSNSKSELILAELKAIRSDLEALKKELSQKESESKKLIDDQNNAEAARKDLEKITAEAEKQKALENAQLEAEKAKAQTAEINAQAAQAELDRLTAANAAAEAIAQAKKVADDAAAAKAAQDAKLVEQQKVTDQANKEVAIAQERLDNVNAELAKLATQKADIEKQLADLNTQMQQAQADTKAAQDAAAQDEADRKALEEKLIQARAASEQAIKEQNSKLLATQSQIDAIALAQKQSEDALNAQIAQLSSQPVISQDQLKALKDQITQITDQSTAKLAALQQQVDSLTGQIKEKESTNTIAATLSQVETQIPNIQKMVDRLVNFTSAGA